MTKAEVIAKIATDTGIDRADVSASVEALFTVVKNSLAEGENVYFRSFGSFVVKERKEKKGRNIAKGKSVIIPAHHVPSFKPAKTFAEKVKSGNKK